MSELYARINHNWVLRGWSDRPRVLMNKKASYSIALTGDYQYVADACNGLCDFHSMAFLPVHREILRQWMEWGVVDPCIKGQGDLTEWQQYRYVDIPHIIEVHWAITGKCNMKCGHCFMEAPSGKYGEMPYEDIDHFSDQFLAANVVRISLTGGEPLHHPEFPRILRMLSQKGFCINQIVTNASLITEDLLDLLDECGQKPDFQISYDGVGTHDQMRGTKNMESVVLDALRLLCTKGYTVAVCTIFSKQNIHTAIETYRLTCELGVSVWLISRAQKMGSWKGGSQELSIKEMGELCLKIFEQWLIDGRPIPMGLEKFYNAQPQIPVEGARKKVKGFTKDSKECETPLWRAFVLPNGTLLPCTEYTGSIIEEKMPNLYQMNFHDIWTQSELRRFNEETKQKRIEANEQCCNCKYLGECGAGCRSYAYTENADIMKNDPIACEVCRGRWEQRFMDAERTFLEEHHDQ